MGPPREFARHRGGGKGQLWLACPPGCFRYFTTHGRVTFILTVLWGGVKMEHEAGLLGLKAWAGGPKAGIVAAYSYGRAKTQP